MGRFFRAGALALLALLDPAWAQQAQHLQITSFAVGPDQTLTYPDSSSGTNQLAGFADEHTTFFPPAASGAPYLVFGAAATTATATGNWGAVVLQTTDLKTFTFATSLGYNFPVLTSPVPFSKCNPTYDTEFDENYAAPGSVLQDPTLPAGNLIMLYDSEQHCPGGVWQSDFYGSVGFARSFDNGKTWPAPESGALGGPSRHAIIQSPEPQPTVPHGQLGDLIPSGFVDKSASGDYYLYVAYGYFSSSGGRSLRVARAKLGADPLTFLKWYKGSFSQPGIGGLDSAVTPSPGCADGEYSPEISYNDDLGLYLMIFKCENGPAGAEVGGWYYSTATSLDLEDWIAPQLIQNSQDPLTQPCPGKTTGTDFDGGYPSTISPGAASGHTKLTGYIFFTHITCDLAARQFLSRTFAIVAGPPVPEISLVANAFGDTPLIAPNTWVEIKGLNLAPAGDSRIWLGPDFVNNQLPTQLDGVSVMVNGKSAFVYYISPTQVNILTPPDAISGPVQVQLTTAGVTSNVATVQAQPLSLSFFEFVSAAGKHYVYGRHLADNSVVGLPGTTPVKPGETIYVATTGFGPTDMTVVSGAITQSGTLPTPWPVVQVGGVTANVRFAGLVSVGTFIVTFDVPTNVPDGDLALTATYKGLSIQPSLLITVQH